MRVRGGTGCMQRSRCPPAGAEGLAALPATPEPLAGLSCLSVRQVVSVRTRVAVSSAFLGRDQPTACCWSLPAPPRARHRYLQGWGTLAWHGRYSLVLTKAAMLHRGEPRAGSGAGAREVARGPRRVALLVAGRAYVPCLWCRGCASSLQRWGRVQGDLHLSDVLCSVPVGGLGGPKPNAGSSAQQRKSTRACPAGRPSNVKTGVGSWRKPFQ